MRRWRSNQPDLRQTRCSCSCITKQRTPTDELQFHQAADTSITKQQTLALSSSNHQHFPLQQIRPCNSPRMSTLLGRASALRDIINIPPVNQGLNKLGHGSSSLCNQCVHIFDRLQLRLRPDHTATPAICTKHRDHLRDHPDLREALSPRTYRQPSLRYSIVQTFNTAESTQTSCSNCDSTPMHTLRVRFFQ